MKLKLGFFLPHLPKDIFENMAVQAEAAGFDYICCDDHLMSPFLSKGSEGLGCYEAWTAMSYLAGKTEKIVLSHMVLVPAFRRPAVLANMAATLDVLSGGRLILTVGAGWYRREFEAYNLPWEKHGARIRREREAIQVIRALWSGQCVDFDGEFYNLKKAELNPRPVQKPAPPIWVAGDSKPSMELAAELGDGWLMHGHAPEEIERMVSKIRPMLGDRVDDFTIASAHAVVMDTDEKAADEKLHRLIPKETWDLFMTADIKKEIRSKISGSSEQCLQRIKEYAQAGINSLTLIFFDPQDVNKFVSEILPELR